jgi:hypothetical protein
MPFLVLFYLCSAGGMAMVLGAMWLLFKEKIFLDAHTREVLYVELPLVGRLTTNAPTIFLIALGSLTTIYPAYLTRSNVTTQTYYKVNQRISSLGHPVTVYLVIHTDVLNQDGDVELPVPKLPDQSYEAKLVYVVNNVATGDAQIPFNQEQKGAITLDARILQFGDPGQPIVKQQVKPKSSRYQ